MSLLTPHSSLLTCGPEKDFCQGRAGEGTRAASVVRPTDGYLFRRNRSGKEKCPGLKPYSSWATYRGLKPAANPKE